MMHKQTQPSLKTLGQWPIILAIAMALPAGGVSLYSLLQLRSAFHTPAPSRPQAPAIVAVTGLGRLEPQGEVIALSAPNNAEGARVAKLLVKEGDKVRAAQVVAILDSYEPRLAALNQAKKEVQVAQARLAKVKAGIPPGEIAAQKATIAQLEAELRGQIAAQKATIARLQAELSNAETEAGRHQQLYREGAISASAFDSKHLAAQTVREQLNEAKATQKRTVQSYQEQIKQAKETLAAKAEVRPVDVQVSQAEVDNAIATVQRAQADLNLAQVRSPIDGQILKIETRPGEIINTKGIAKLGQTDQMYAEAEIYETDISKVSLGQRATLTSQAFSGKLQGIVTEIGRQVSQQNIFSVNPAADTDQKIVRVKVRIDEADNQKVSGLTNLQVQVAIRI